MNNDINKYNSVSSSGRPMQELMIQVLQKGKNHILVAKKYAEKKDFVELGRNIIKVVQILETLARTSSIDRGIDGMGEVQKIYETLAFQVENLVAKRAKPEEYDYFIEYFDKLQKSWQVANDATSASEIVNISSEVGKEVYEKEEDISSFYKDGKFEIIT